MGGGGSTYDYGFRIYNPQIAKFLSVDPLTRTYPWYTPYQFAGNKPIWAIDLDGLEEYIVTVWYKDDNYWGTTIRKINQEDVSRKAELQPFGRSGAYYIKKDLPADVKTLEELQANQNNSANWARVLPKSIKEPTKNSYYTEHLEPVDQGLVKLQNPYNYPQKRSHLAAGQVDLKFDLNSDILSADNKALLDNYAYFVSSLEGTKVTLEGFASTEGSTDYNKSLSEKRVNAVKNYLVSKILQYNPNVNPNDIVMSGKGAGETATYGAELENNRRVTINIAAPKKKFLNHSAKNEY